MSTPYVPAITRFEAKVAPMDSDGHVLWTGAINDDGYGKFRFGGRSEMAHIAAWQLYVGPIPDGMEVDHRCSTPACVSIQHLRLVTHAQNQQHRKGANKNSQSGVRGVCFDIRTGRWRAEVLANGERHWLGRFDTLAEAEAAVIAKRLEVFTHSDPEMRTA